MRSLPAVGGGERCVSVSAEIGCRNGLGYDKEEGFLGFWDAHASSGLHAPHPLDPQSCPSVEAWRLMAVMIVRSQEACEPE